VIGPFSRMGLLIDRDVLGLKRPKTFWRSVRQLIGHLLATSLIFLLLFAIAWALSWLLTCLDSLHKFPPEIFEIITRCEVWLIYGDVIMSAAVLIVGAFRFFGDLFEVGNHA
jgi:hypothetical protein